jgi:hypothetical protein
MRETHTRFEQIPIAIAEKVLKLQQHFAKRDGSWKLVVRKSNRTRRGLRMRSGKARVSLS